MVIFCVTVAWGWKITTAAETKRLITPREHYLITYVFIFDFNRFQERGACIIYTDSCRLCSVVMLF